MEETQVVDEVRSRVRAIDDGASRMIDLVRESELLVLDMFPSTAFMESMTADVPIIAIVPEDAAFTENAASFYDEFFKIGLLHKSPASAAAFLNHLNVRHWWQGVTRLTCFKEYLATFCNRDLSLLSLRERL
jgi:putative transferase (TIGR04331 family)